MPFFHNKVYIIFAFKSHKKKNVKSDNVNIKNKNPTEPRSSVAERVLQAVEGGGRAESPAGPAHSTTCSQERSGQEVKSSASSTTWRQREIQDVV